MKMYLVTYTEGLQKKSKSKTDEEVRLLSLMKFLIFFQLSKKEEEEICDRLWEKVHLAFSTQ